MITYERGKAPEDALLIWHLESNDFGNTYVITAYDLPEVESFYVFDSNLAEAICEAFYMSRLADKAKRIFDKNITKSYTDLEVAATEWTDKYNKGSLR